MWEYEARRVPGDKDYTDGDSLTLEASLGFDARMFIEVRLLDVFAPELHQPGGQETAAYVHAWLAETEQLQTRRWPLLIRTQPDRSGLTERRTFTRWLAHVWSADRTRHLNSDVLAFLDAHPDWPRGIGG